MPPIAAAANVIVRGGRREVLRFIDWGPAPPTVVVVVVVVLVVVVLVEVLR